MNRRRLRFSWVWLPLAVLALRYPVYAFLIHFSGNQGLQPWDENFKTWCTWDCKRFATLSGHYGIEDVAFFPGHPLATMAFRALFPFLTGTQAVLIISNLFSVVGMGLVLYYGKLLEGGREAEAGLPKTLRPWLFAFLVAVFPANYFMSSGYSEALALVCFVGTLVFLMRKELIAAAAFAGIGSVVRNQGSWIASIFVAFILVDLLQPWLSRRFPKVPLKRPFGESARTDGIAFVLAVAPFLSFLLWQFVEKGTPFYYVKAMQQWHRSFSFRSILIHHVPKYDLSFILLALSWIAGIRFLRRAGGQWKFLGTVTLVLAVLPLSVGGYGGYLRYMGSSIGIFVFLSEVFASRPWLAYPWLGWSVFRLAVEIEGWTQNQWRG